MTSRIDIIGQNGNDAVAYRRELNPPTSNLHHTQAVEMAKVTGMCSDGRPCGENHAFFDDYCDYCPNEPNQSEPDNVNHPAHYQSESGIECIEAIRAQLTSDQFTAYCQGNVVKYLWRWREKGGVESLRKAKWYLDRMIAEVVDE